MITRTASSLIQGALERANAKGSTDGRHEEGLVLGYVNSALRRVFLELSANGVLAKRRAVLTTTADTADADGWPANEVVALPAMTSLLGVSIDNGSVTRPMLAFDELERDEPSSSLRDTGAPQFHRLAEDNAGALVLQLLPPADGAYSIEVYYTAAAPTLGVDDSYTFFPGADEWVECDAALAILERDEVPDASQLQAIGRRMAMCHQTCMRHLSRLRPRPMRVRNTRRLRAEARHRAAGYLRGV